MRILLIPLLLAACVESSEPSPDPGPERNVLVVPTNVRGECPPPGWVPTCKEMGCDGTQSVPLYCPGDEEICFCAAPTATDGWCERY